jgi:hypothetical protein
MPRHSAHRREEDYEDDDDNPDDREAPDSSDQDDDDGAEEAETRQCVHCGADVYEFADRCPHCGGFAFEQGPGRTNHPRWVVVTALILLVLLVYLVARHVF